MKRAWMANVQFILVSAVLSGLGVAGAQAAESGEIGSIALNHWLWSRLGPVVVFGAVAGWISGRLVAVTVKNRDGVDVNAAARRRLWSCLVIVALVFFALLFFDLIFVSGTQFKPYGLTVLEAVVIIFDWRAFVMLVASEVIAALSGVAYLRFFGKSGGLPMRYAFSFRSRR